MMNTIKCAHHHFLQCAPTRAPKLRFASGAEVAVSVTCDLVADIASRRCEVVLVTIDHTSTSKKHTYLVRRAAILRDKDRYSEPRGVLLRQQQKPSTKFRSRGDIYMHQPDV